jgi:hypothetical protein
MVCIIYLDFNNHDGALILRWACNKGSLLGWKVQLKGSKLDLGQARANMEWM